MDRAAVFGTVDGGSIPLEGASLSSAPRSCFARMWRNVVYNIDVYWATFDPDLIGRNMVPRNEVLKGD